ncbi:hypothetical protein [uncultured Tyzzerella sp.]|uniref:hypothetical protein n=1 Tax=uncultured Tyzzerella sp. TaxID=2321398 RepID=UPI0029420B63|nr:hypothetical protein [uncultured Tyzzerella sp.]
MNENEEGNIEENREDGFEIINSGEDVSSLIKSVSALSGIDPSCKYLDWQYIVHNF